MPCLESNNEVTYRGLETGEPEFALQWGKASSGLPRMTLEVRSLLDRTEAPTKLLRGSLPIYWLVRRSGLPVRYYRESLYGRDFDSVGPLGHSLSPPDYRLFSENLRRKRLPLSMWPRSVPGQPQGNQYGPGVSLYLPHEDTGHP